MIEIYATYNGESFPVKIGGEYEFSDGSEFATEHTYKGILDFLVARKDLACPYGCKFPTMTNWFKYIRPIQPKEVKPLTHKEIDMNLVGKGKFKHIYAYENGRWNCVNATFCFFSDLDTDHEKWHPLTTDLLDMIKERE